MPSLLELLLLALATHRVASLFSNEEGPFGMFARLRKLGGEKVVNGTRTATTWWGKGLICLWCVSTWCGAFFFLLYLLVPYWWYLALPSAYSDVAIMIDRMVNDG